MRSLSLSILMPLGLSLMVVGCNQPEAGNTATSNAKPVPAPAATLPEISKSTATTPPPPPPDGSGHPQAAVESRKAANTYVGLDENGIDIGLTKINEALKQFVQDTERLPKDLNELVKSGAMARLPTPPPGKKYTLDPASKTAVLASQ